MVISLSLPRKGDPKSPNFVGTKGSEIQAFCWRIVCMSTPRSRRRFVGSNFEFTSPWFLEGFEILELWGNNKNLKMMIVLESFENKLITALQVWIFEKYTHADVFSIDFFSGLLLIAWESNNLFSNSSYPEDFMKSSNKNISQNISSTFFYISSILGGRRFGFVPAADLLNCSLAY